MPSSLTYIGKDFSSIRNQLIAAIPSKTDRWTDLNQSDVGVTLLELWASIGDMLAFYLDQQALETFLTTCRQRKNLINLVKLIGYRLEHVVSAVGNVTFSITSPHANRIEIPKYTKLGTSSDPGEDPIFFVTTELGVIAPGTTEIVVGVRQGVISTELFTGDGTPNQRFRLAETAVDISSIEVIVNNVIWQQVTSFVNAQSSDRVYLVEVGADNSIDLLFGDGFFGLALPDTGGLEAAKVNYVISKGSDGNVGSNTVTAILSSVKDVTGATISLGANNTDPIYGGADQETIEHARKQAPAELSALFRAMTKADYIALCEGFPGILKATAWGEQDNNPPNYDLFNWVMLSVVPDGVTTQDLRTDVAVGQPSDQLVENLFEYLETRKCITTRLHFTPPVFKPIGLTATVYVKAGYSETTVHADVVQALEDFMSLDNVSFGKELRKSNVIRVADAVDGVEYVQLQAFHTTGPPSIQETIPLYRYEIPYLESLVITAEKYTDAVVTDNKYGCEIEPTNTGD